MVEIPENKDYVPEEPQKKADEIYAERMEEIVGYLRRPDVNGVAVYVEDPYDERIPKGFDGKTSVASFQMDRFFISSMIDKFRKKHYYVYWIELSITFGYYLISKKRIEGAKLA